MTRVHMMHNKSVFDQSVKEISHPTMSLLAHTTTAECRSGCRLAALLDNQRPHVVPCLRVVLGVRPVAVGELLGLPAPAEHSLVAHVLDVNGVHHLGTLHLDGLVTPVGLHAPM